MTVRVKDYIPLPTKLRKAWRGQEVFIFSSGDDLIVKRIQKIVPDDLRARLKLVGKKITKKDLAAAIRAARTRK